MEGASPSVDARLWMEINNAVKRVTSRKESMRPSNGNGKRSYG